MVEPNGERDALFDADGADAIRLRARRCRTCGAVWFPPQDHGCEHCGAPPDAIEVVDLASTGEVRASTVVHAHPFFPTPFAVGVIALDAGPVVRALLDTREAVPAGTRVEARAVAAAGSGTPDAPGTPRAHDPSALHFARVAEPAAGPEGPPAGGGRAADGIGPDRGADPGAPERGP